MGLKKLFSTKEKEDKSNEHRRSMSRTSTLSHAISHFTHKDKHQSLDIKQPSPNSSTSFVSSPTTLTPTTKVTQNDEPVAHHQHALSRPITPSDSMRDVYDVLHVIQKTDSSEQDFLPSDATIPIATPDSKSQVHVPPPARFLTMDSNKFEVEDEDDDDSQHHGGVTDTPIEDDDSDSAAKDSLYQELLLVKQQLDTANPRNAVDMKKRLDMVNELLINALESSSRLDTKLKSVIDTSKQAMVAVKDENTMLRSSLDELKEKHQGQLEGLQTKLNEFNNTHLLLFHDDDDQDGNLQDKIKRVLTCNEKQTEEMKTLKSQIESLQMKAENDAMTMANQEIKLESCTTQIRDLQAENMRLLAENDACSILKKTLESTKEENLELQSNAQAAQTELLTLRKSENVSSLLEARLRQELTDMEAASKAFMDENETIQQENTKLIELVQSLEAKVTELSSKDEQDELMRMHTRAQLGLIEYLEGEENVPLAMAKFKKQLEAEMREFALASH